MYGITLPFANGITTERDQPDMCNQCEQLICCYKGYSK